MGLPNKEEPLISWFKDQVLPELVNNGHFSAENKQSTIEKCEFEITSRGTDHFASCPYFIKVVLRKESETSEFDLVVKFTSQDPAFRAAMKTDGQFYNEMQMYNLVVPTYAKFLSQRNREKLVCEIVPKSYFACFDKDKPEKALIILEDLRKSGFKVAESTSDLDVHHCKVALKQLARFHAISLSIKEAAPELMDKLKNSCLEVRYNDEPENKEFHEAFLAVCIQRGFDYLENKNRVPEEYLKKLRHKISADVFELMQKLVEPDEPFSVLCHGDFCRNNVLFRYQQGTPVDARLFDFQTYRYSSPCVDLSFFLFMNTTLELRKQFLDELLQLYHSTLTRTMSQVLDKPEEDIARKYSLELLKKDFAERATYGYIIASFFLPMMMAPAENAACFEEDFLGKSFKQMAEETVVQGGDAVSKRIAEVIIDFYERGYYS